MRSTKVVVVGGGQSGLAVSYNLALHGFDHVVLERQRVGESWRSQRWDSFCFNTHRGMSQLPGDPATTAGTRDQFWTRNEFVSYMAAYVERHRLPVETGVSVTDVRRGPALKRGFRVESTQGSWSAEAVVIASGSQNVPVVPALSREVPAHVTQLTAASYRNPASLPPGGVLVVGSGQSGCQIAEELVESGRRVFLATSRVGRNVRRYRGRDIYDWLSDTGVLDAATPPGSDGEVRALEHPNVISGTRGGHTISLQSLSRGGVTLLGRLRGVNEGGLWFADDVVDNLRFADESSAGIQRRIDAFIDQGGMEAPPAEIDPADVPDSQVEAVVRQSQDTLSPAEIGSIVWCVGFTGDFSYLRIPVLDEVARPRRAGTNTDVRGLYLLGFRGLVNMRSTFVSGAAPDSESVVRDLVASRS